MSEDNRCDFEKMMEVDDIPDDPKQVLKQTQKLRFGLIKKEIKNSDDPAMMGQLLRAAADIDKQEITMLKLAQDKEEGEATREVAIDVFNKMVAGNFLPGSDAIKLPEEATSGMEILPGELIQGDDTLDSVID